MRVAVLRGGRSAGYEDSLSSGESVLNVLRAEPSVYEPVDIYIAPDGTWHRAGIKVLPEKVFNHSDLIFNTLQGPEPLLAVHKVPYTGTHPLHSALARQGYVTRERLRQNDLPLPRSIILETSVTLPEMREVFRTYLHPLVVLPGERVVTSFDDLLEAVAEAFRDSTRVVVEEQPRGREVYSGVVEGLRGEKLYALFPYPISKNIGNNRTIEGLARKVHEVLNLRHYSKTRFVLTPSGKIYITQIDPNPSLSDKSPFMQSLHSSGVSTDECVKHLINLALQK
jgi:D-alanine-D-alanine ligase